MTSQDPPAADPATVLQNLAQVLYEHESFDDITSALCVAATMLIPGCDHASLMMRESGRYFTAAASDDVALTVDQFERQLEQGPCVDAIEDESVQLENDLSAPSQWPELSKAVLASTPVRSAMAFRIRTDSAKTGALNLFADRVNAFDSAAMDQAVIVAAFASILVSARTHKEKSDSLLGGLTHSREIGKAIGLLMSIHGIDDEQAFELLKSASQRTNIKLAEVARRVVDQHRKTLR
ncbi:GAF and ANTAR domain-containing protein [Smaragdicoccus niigatensis]|uniref:GAF and ANTAR domain-containing protein n=1 Tax=Smaragdicoccus niigatensis TaxID=359359 RepID=UPI00037A7B6D|nr:GAF and ANTAR domain-containing protein [Smaragdicoccus niigatensis]